jgi:hypothetical protein
MNEVAGFRRGSDLGDAGVEGNDEVVECVACGKTESDERAYDDRWQMEPPVCPDCLRWSTVGVSECCDGSDGAGQTVRSAERRSSR